MNSYSPISPRSNQKLSGPKGDKSSSKKSRTRRRKETRSQKSKRELSYNGLEIKPPLEDVDVSLNRNEGSNTDDMSEMSLDVAIQEHVSSHRALHGDPRLVERRGSRSPTRPNFFIPGINGTPRCLEETKAPSSSIFHKTSSSNWRSTSPRTRRPYRKTRYQQQLDQSGRSAHSTQSYQHSRRYTLQEDEFSEAVSRFDSPTSPRRSCDMGVELPSFLSPRTDVSSKKRYVEKHFELLNDCGEVLATPTSVKDFYRSTYSPGDLRSGWSDVRKTSITGDVLHRAI